MEIKYSGLKCDYCDFKDPDVAREQYEESINRKCPKCGENLLTLEDYTYVIILENAVKEAEKIKIKEKDGEIKTFEVDLHKGIKFKEK